MKTPTPTARRGVFFVLDRHATVETDLSGPDGRPDHRRGAEHERQRRHRHQHQAGRRSVHPRHQDADRALIFVSLVTGVASLQNLSTMGRISIKTFVLYLATTAVAITIGLRTRGAVPAGRGRGLGTAAAVSAKAAPTLTETILGLVPTNPVAAFAEGNVLQIIVFAIFVGLAITLAGEAAKPVGAFFDSAAEVMYKLTSIIISFAPYGVFALMVWVAGAYGMDVLAPLAKVIALVYGLRENAALVYAGLIVRRPPQPGALFPGQHRAGDGGLHQHLQLGHAAGHDDVGRA